MIDVNDLHKSFDDHTVLHGLTFSVAPGEIYGLLGPNGSGKTTTINILCNLLDADSGTVLIQGNEVSEVTKYRMGIVPQEIALYELSAIRAKDRIQFILIGGDNARGKEFRCNSRSFLSKIRT